MFEIERIDGDDEEVLSDWLVAGNATSVKASDRDPRGVDVKGRRDTFTGKGWNGIRRCIAIGWLDQYEFHVRIAFVRNVCMYMCVCMCVRVCENIGGGILEGFIHGIVFRMRKKFDYCLR